MKNFMKRAVWVILVAVSCARGSEVGDGVRSLWNEHETAVISALESGTSGSAFSEACDFFSAVTGIESRHEHSYVGDLPSDATSDDLRLWRDWFRLHGGSLTLDSTIGVVRDRHSDKVLWVQRRSSGHLLPDCQKFEGSGEIPLSALLVPVDHDSALVRLLAASEELGSKPLPTMVADFEARWALLLEETSDSRGVTYWWYKKRTSLSGDEIGLVALMECRVVHSVALLD
jgi:hypothetical protein